jgi:hypothetical protein
MPFINFPLRQMEAVKKLLWCCFTSFRRKPESSVFMKLQIRWTPVFTCLREAASAKAGRGDEYSVISLQLQED